jgi:hypothetical protein
MDLPSEAIGFHGTSRDAVARLLARDIRPSDEHFEWLGSGFWLWQDSPWRARDWAEEQFGSDAAVGFVRVDLDGCLDLLNPHWHAGALGGLLAELGYDVYSVSSLPQLDAPPAFAGWVGGRHDDDRARAARGHRRSRALCRSRP